MTPEQAAILALLDRIERLERIVDQQAAQLGGLSLRQDRIEREARTKRLQGAA